MGNRTDDTIDWERAYAEGVMPWEKGAPTPVLTSWLAGEGNRLEGDVLVPGCGFGHDAAAIARHGRSRSVLGLDVVPAAIARARALHHERGLTFQVADFFQAGSGICDWIFEHTCYCAIAPARRPDYIEAAWRALRPGGRLLAVFFLTPWDPGEDQDQGPPFGTAAADLETRFERRFELLESYVPTAAYPGREGRELLQLLARKP